MLTERFSKSHPTPANYSSAQNVILSNRIYSFNYGYLHRNDNYEIRIELGEIAAHVWAFCRITLPNASIAKIFNFTHPEL